MTMKPEFKDVSSSNIAAIAHHGDTLHVRFHNGSVWKYSDVDQKLYNDMLLAGSVGKYFNEHIKRFKSGEKVDLPAEAPPA